MRNVPWPTAALVLLLISACLLGFNYMANKRDVPGTGMINLLQNCPECDCPVYAPDMGKEITGNPPRGHDPQVLSSFQAQTKLELLDEIRKDWLKPPSYKPYNFKGERKDKNLQAVNALHEAVLAIFNKKTNGFFIECGAFDGLFLSNTIHLEKGFQWTGLLVEADPENFKILFSRERKAWSINACLALTTEAGKVKMTRKKGAGAWSSLTETGLLKKEDAGNEEFETQCFPLTSILAALGQTMNVDYFSLDIEGAELGVLSTIPWDYVYIKVISLEANPQRIPPIKEFLLGQNYVYGGVIQGPWIYDHIFIHKSFAKESSVPVSDIQGLLDKLKNATATSTS